MASRYARTPSGNVNPITGQIAAFHQKHSQPSTPEKIQKDLGETLATLSLNDPERTHKVKVVNLFLQLWHSFQDADYESTGFLTPADFRRAIEQNGLKFGSREVDKILLYVTFTEDGRVDYRKFEDHIDSLINAIPARNPQEQVNIEDSFTLVPPSTNRRELPPDEEFREQKQRLKELVMLNNHKISEAFLRYEQDRLSLEDFVAVLRMMNLNANTTVLKVLRRKNEFGACSYTKLIQALSLPEDKIHEFETKTIRRATLVEKSPVREPPAESAPRIRHAVNRPNSLRDSNVLTWEDDPKKPRATKKGNAALLVVEKQEQPLVKTTTDPDLQFAKQEKINSLIRDFIDGLINGTVFRASIRELGIEINREIERLIGGYERDGRLTFNELHRAIRLYAKGDVQFSFQKEEVPNTNIFQSNIQFTWSPEAPRPSTSQSLNGNNSGELSSTRSNRSSSVLTWENDQPETPKRVNNNLRSSVLIGEAPREPQTPTTPNRVNKSSLNPTDWESPVPKPTHIHTQTKVHPDRLESPNVVTWTNPPYKRHEPLPEGPSPLDGTKRHYNRSDVLNTGASVHPVAPFGTARDHNYNVNPHHYSLGKRPV